ncbi:family 1 encapsulin nanocompartment shell protein [Pyrofollis japonicus]|uniref:encapsulin n=1 Tax=Pyrofollis japonicus TaxID=3060460 RepID=UPI00295A9F10|nr:family 1 encapsulin nanocompartment shell protein [Pyrofollis japonicus]BEP16692.1 family 1 encapsulin nanocompartment shell protein [Pyrofollis japonicus]
MFARHPLELAKDKLSGKDLADALRLAIMAELDAINLYLQIAEKAEREDVKKVFMDVAREEKTHVGEFLEMLKKLDPEQVEELKKGAEEVAEILGEPGANPSSDIDDPGDPDNGERDSFEKVVVKAFIRSVESSRVLRRALPVTLVGPGVDYVVATSIAYGEQGVGVESETVVPLREVFTELVIPQRLVDRYSRLGEPIDPLISYAAKKFVQSEERLLIEQLLGVKEALSARLGTWERGGEAVDDIAKAVSLLEAEGFRGPFVVLVPTQRYTKLLAVHERTGVMELTRVEKLAKVVRTPLLPGDKVVVLAAEKNALDIVVGTDTRVDYIGLETGGHRFRAWETITLRILNPHGIVVLSAE